MTWTVRWKGEGEKHTAVSHPAGLDRVVLLQRPRGGRMAFWQRTQRTRRTGRPTMLNMLNLSVYNIKVLYTVDPISCGHLRDYDTSITRSISTFNLNISLAGFQR